MNVDIWSLFAVIAPIAAIAAAYMAYRADREAAAASILAIELASEARRLASLAIERVASSRASRLEAATSSSLRCSSADQIPKNFPTSSVLWPNCRRASSNPSFSNSGEYGKGFGVLIDFPNRPKRLRHRLSSAGQSSLDRVDGSSDCEVNRGDAVAGNK